MPSRSHEGVKSRLPIDDVIGEVIRAVRTHRRVVIQAPPGAGKSTRVPSGLLDAGVTDKDIVLLEPRRVAARSVAKRIAFERGSKIGDEVGWRVRWDTVGSRATRLWVATEGVVTQRALSDPFLEDIGLLILDEFHERSVDTDLAIAFAAQLLDLRDDFSVVVMSATLDAPAIASFLDAPVVAASGRSFDVATTWLSQEPSDLVSAVRGAVLDAVRSEDDGDILVFLPGLREIDDCYAACAGIDIDRHRLHSQLPDAEQDAALSGHGPRKVIFATNIAESSLTLPRVTTVIDSGLVRQSRADVGTGFDRLETVASSLASATQRAGRAGRVRPGKAVRLWTRASEYLRPEFDAPTIRRVDLTGPALAVARWSGGSPEEFRWYERPSDAQLAAATATLEAIGALRDGVVTTVGAELSRIPAHPRVAKFLWECAARGAQDLGARAAACLTEHDWVTSVSDPVPHRSDLLLRLEHLDEVAAGRTQAAQRAGLRVSVDSARNVQRVAKTFARLRLPTGEPERDALDAALAAAYADRVAFHASGRRYALASGGSVVLDRASAVREAEAIIALSVFGTAHVDGVACGICRLASTIDARLLPEALRSEVVEVSFDASLGRLVARRVERFGDFVVRATPASFQDLDADPERDARLLAAAVARDVVAAWGLEKDSLRLLQRIDFLRRWMPEIALPDPRDPEVLLQLVWGVHSFDELRRAGFERLYVRTLNGAQRDALASHAPDKIALPKSAFRVDYSDIERPVLAARIQDFFGVETTPQIADGRVTLTLHLLAPNQRPQQVTQDLASFWRTTYTEVRRDLRARYPKHDWPEP